MNTSLLKNGELFTSQYERELLNKIEKITRSEESSHISNIKTMKNSLIDLKRSNSFIETEIENLKLQKMKEENSYMKLNQEISSLSKELFMSEEKNENLELELIELTNEIKNKTAYYKSIQYPTSNSLFIEIFRKFHIEWKNDKNIICTIKNKKLNDVFTIFHDDNKTEKEINDLLWKHL
ncbi:hypothetical protein CWI37_2197p0010 [Hamiltosporidium tvaerminnensis]|uniref:Kinetochore protein Spc24 n=2 Tax=Hamiltosporidium TaxID=1176354 RepID=A0A4Q9LDX6_9MICR|nr:hypothetical protein CWI37_2197p0010 [Hamiltosporidium tvaerminnensis]TBU06064.1 hypothetical protein CWI36_0522p0020 [Hamiltosporidium magnivora]